MLVLVVSEVGVPSLNQIKVVREAALVVPGIAAEEVGVPPSGMALESVAEHQEKKRDPPRQRNNSHGR